VVLIPLGSIGALVIDLVLSLALCGLLMVHYHWPVSLSLLLLQVFALGCLLAAGGTGLILSALNVSFRDMKYAAPFLIQMGIFITPVIYPVCYIPARWQRLMGNESHGRYRCRVPTRPVGHSRVVDSNGNITGGECRVVLRRAD